VGIERRDLSELVDPRLKTFRREDWETPDDTNHFDALRAWKAARAEWVAQHPDSLALGDASERFRTEFQTQMAQYDRKATSWSDYERGGPSFAWDDPSNDRYARPREFTQPPRGQFPRKPQPRKQSRKQRKR
jgi:hypothetical protein